MINFRKYKMKIQIKSNNGEVNYTLYGFSKWFVKFKYFISGIKHRHNDWGGNPKYVYLGEYPTINVNISLNK